MSIVTTATITVTLTINIAITNFYYNHYCTCNWNSHGILFHPSNLSIGRIPRLSFRRLGVIQLTPWQRCYPNAGISTDWQWRRLIMIYGPMDCWYFHISSCSLYLLPHPFQVLLPLMTKMFTLDRMCHTLNSRVKLVAGATMILFFARRKQKKDARAASQTVDGSSGSTGCQPSGWILSHWALPLHHGSWQGNPVFLMEDSMGNSCVNRGFSDKPCLITRGWLLQWNRGIFYNARHLSLTMLRGSGNWLLWALTYPNQAIPDPEISLCFIQKSSTKDDKLGLTRYPKVIWQLHGFHWRVIGPPNKIEQ